MTQNDNFRYYYGQSLINKDTVSEYESILDYIKSHGGSGSGIDADMLDGHDSNDFLLIGQSDAYMPPGFYIGYSTIENKSQPALQFLYSRDIKCNGEYRYMFSNAVGTLKIKQLYDQLLGDNSDTIFTRACNIYTDDNWNYDHEDKLLEAGLCDLELAIYCLLEYENQNKADLEDQINSIRNATLNEEQFNQIQYILHNYLVEFNTYDNEGNITTNKETVLDAGAVNGLRFFLVTQQQYDQYPLAIQEDPRYIFIIKDEVPEGYVTPTTISANSFKPLFKTGMSDNGDYCVMVSVDNGQTYYEAGKFYQSAPNEDGLIPMYIGGETLPIMLADPTTLGDNFFINGAWMREFLSADPSTVGTLDDMIQDRISQFTDRINAIENSLNTLVNNNYEYQSNKLQTGYLNDSIEQYPSSRVVKVEIDDLKAELARLDAKLGEMDQVLTRILGTG